MSLIYKKLIKGQPLTSRLGKNREVQAQGAESSTKQRLTCRAEGMAVAHTTTCQNYCSLCCKKHKETGFFFIRMILKGTKFQLKVWKYLKSIPKGKVKTYKQVAIAIKRPKAARAVANACGKNPYAPIIPCHRVVRSDGSLGGYSGAGGIKTKKILLKKEGYLL